MNMVVRVVVGEREGRDLLSALQSDPDPSAL